MTAKSQLEYAGQLDNQRRVAELLLANGANVNARDVYGNTPLHIAGMVFFPGFFDNTDLVELLLSKGADLNAKNDEGDTALMIAADSVRLGVVKALLARGADVNATNKDGKTALNQPHIGYNPGRAEIEKRY